MTVITALINIIVLSCAIAYILWGKQIFKVYIILSGILTGAMLGGVIGTLSSFSSDGMWGGALMGAIILGVLAWPIRIVFIFLISGAIIGSLAALFLAWLGLPSGLVLPLGIISFVAGGIVGVKFDQYLIIIIMAYSGAAMLFTNTFNFFALSGRSSSDPMQILNMLFRMVSGSFMGFLFFVSMFILFALYFQKKLADLKKDSAAEKLVKSTTRKIAYFFSGYAVLSSVIATLAASRTMAGPGISVIHMPILVVVTAWCFQWLKTNEHRLPQVADPRTNRIIYLAVYSFTVVPIACGTVNLFFGILMGAPVGSAFQGLFYDYIALFQGPGIAAMFKWIFMAALVPAALFHLLKESENLQTGPKPSPTPGQEVPV